MKTFYIVVKTTSFCGGNWGKGTSLRSAMNSCKVKKLSDNFVIYQAIIKDTATDEQVENLCKCFNVNDLGGVNLYSDPSKEDLDMVNEYLLGWITNEDFVTSKSK
jgi:hypothetical protein